MQQSAGAFVYNFDLVFHVLSFLDSNDLAIAGQVCTLWCEAAGIHQRRMLTRLTAKAMEWVQANDGAMLAGSLPLYHDMAKRDGVPPRWVSGDADVWVFALRSSPRHTGATFQINGPDTDKLKYGGRVLCHGMPVISTITYPFGTVQVIMAGSMNDYNVWTDIVLSHEVILGAFDHTACMIGMTAPDTFVLGAHFNVDQPTMTERVDYGAYVVPKRERERFRARRKKYTQRGLAPVEIKPVRADKDLWLKYYFHDGITRTVNILNN